MNPASQHSSEALRAAESIRVGAVSYLNTKPLVSGLAEAIEPGQLVFELPSRLSDQLAANQLDVALVPSVELARHPEWLIISDACIACRGPVLSVKLLFRVPPGQVRTLALDEGSRSSAVMAQVLLAELHHVRPTLSSLPIGSDLASAHEDAVLMIGDRAMNIDETQFVEVWDLGDRWCRWAELPFVFAMWVARPTVATQHVAAALTQARDQGVGRLDAIAREQAAAMSLPQDLVENYLRQNLYFHLGSQELRGLRLFYEQAAALQLIESPPEVFVDDCTVEG